MADLGKTPRCLIITFLALIPFPNSVSVVLCPFIKVLFLKLLAILYGHSSYPGTKRNRQREDRKRRDTAVYVTQLQDIHHTIRFQWEQLTPQPLCSSNLLCHELSSHTMICQHVSSASQILPFPRTKPQPRAHPSHSLD